MTLKRESCGFHLGKEISFGRKKRVSKQNFRNNEENLLMIYKLYGLTKKEMEIVENFAKEKGIN